MKLGICTGGGDCPGLNAAIRAATKHAIGSFGMEVIGIKDSFNGLMKSPQKFVPLNFASVTDILSKGGTILGTENRDNPLKDPARRQKSIKAVHDSFRALALDGLIVVGGEGTQSMAATLAETGLNIVGIPKTIDNDLPGSDVTIGFSSAVDIVAEALVRLKSTAESHDRIMVLEVMGRDSGYIALHGGLAGGAHSILFPEIPFDLDAVCEKIKARQLLGRNYSLVVVAEGAKPIGGEAIYQDNKVMGNNLGGVGFDVAAKLKEKTGMETRVTVLGHVQRGGPPNASDRILATRLGVRAVDLFHQKKFGKCVVYRNGKLDEVELGEYVKGKRAPVQLDSDIVKAAESVGVCLGRKLSFKTQD